MVWKLKSYARETGKSSNYNHTSKKKLICVKREMLKALRRSILEQTVDLIGFTNHCRFRWFTCFFKIRFASSLTATSFLDPHISCEAKRWVSSRSTIGLG
ncbi:MAG: hypothetical protein RL632_1505 [Bacteroidota bacterium]|jgi:hypothetical protein